MLACHLVTLPSLAIADEPNAPNVVLIIADDLGVNDVGAYNPDTFYETPNIDSLARRGALFTDSYSASPVCSPARYAILTGKNPVRSKLTDWFHRPGVPHRSGLFRPAHSRGAMPSSDITIAEALRSIGYQAWHVGKWHLGQGAEHGPMAQGFDVNIAGHGGGSPNRNGLAQGYFSPYGNPSLADGPPGEFLTDRLAAEAASLITGRDRGRPFFLHLSFYAVHTPLQAPTNLFEKYRAKGSRVDPATRRFANEEQVWPKSGPRSVRIIQDHAIYSAMVEKLDNAVGTLLEVLAEEGVERDTIVIFTSDNGGLSTAEGSPTSNSPFRGGKGWLYEGGLRVPLIVVVPGAEPAERRIAVPVTGLDVFPTIASLIGAPQLAETAMDGIALDHANWQSTGQEDRLLIWHYPHYSNQGGFPGTAIRRGDWKLIQRHEDGSLQLFNLAADPGETNDLAAENPGILAPMLEVLSDWYSANDAEFLRPLEVWRPKGINVDED